MNWGLKIFILYAGFVLLTLSMVFFTMSQDIFLVEKDYYKQEIAYQDQIDKISKARTLEVPLRMEYDSLARSLTLTYPPEQAEAGIQGRLVLFRPSDARLDQEFDLHPDERGTQYISLQELKRGRWRLKVHWQSMGTAYFKEEIIDIF